MKKFIFALLLSAALLFSGQTAFADKGWEIKPPETPEETRVEPLASLFNFGVKPKNELADILEDPVLKEIINLIDRNYVDKNPNKEKMIEGALNGMLKSLDHHSHYLNPEKAKLEKESIQGEFAGIGAVLEMKNGNVVVLDVYENSPAEKAGIKAGDIIIKVKDDSGEIAADDSVNLEDVVKRIRGAPGTKVTLTVFRKEAPSPLKIEITRGKVKIINVVSKKFNDVGYVKMAQFAEKSADDLGNAVEKLKKQGAAKIILDLRNNPGGLLSSVNDIASMFLSPAKIITSLNGRGGQILETHISTGGKYAEIPLVILTNGGSASASEIMAAAIKENGRGKIVGENTFGKGSVQTVVFLSNGGNIHLTIAHFYSPLGNKIHGVGVAPDVKVEITDANNFKMGDPEKDPQLKKALEILK